MSTTFLVHSYNVRTTSWAHNLSMQAFAGLELVVKRSTAALSEEFGCPQLPEGNRACNIEPCHLGKVIDRAIKLFGVIEYKLSGFP